MRKRLSNQNKFFQCSGYLLAFRNGIVKGFPLEIPEDSIIPYLCWKENYKIKYLPKSEVYVISPKNWKDYKNQKLRIIKAHENLNKVIPDMPRTKSFFNEIKEGFLFSINYPQSFKEFIWTLELIFTRFYIYLNAFYYIKFKKRKFVDGWRKTEIKSTKPLD